MLVEFFGEEPGNDIEIFIVMRGQPAGVFLGVVERATGGWKVLGAKFECVGTEHFSSSSGAKAPLQLRLMSRLKPRPTNPHTGKLRLKITPGGASSSPTRKMRIVGRSRANGELDFAATGFHALEGLRQLIEANLFGDDIVGEGVAPANRFQRFADEAGRVMERRNNLNLRIVNFGRLDFDELTGRQGAEEIHP